jgi:3-hydroxyisobutyrate dehydrogenase-like beta-hydroxyacid dehydrogenase
VTPQRIAFIGFGEVGSILARDLRAAGQAQLVAFDIAFADPASKASRNAGAAGLRVASSANEVAAGAELVICCVTAGSALAAAASATGGLGHAPFFLDVNSVSPGTKREVCEAVTAAGGRYVEAAVMTSVPPHGIRSPMLLGGPHAEAFLPLAEALGMRAQVFSAEVGGASSVKMCRSIMIKGLEALTTECMLTARRYGVERYVLDSLADTLPHEDWPGLARYMMSRALIHGRRRAEEVREVVRTVEEAGLAPMQSPATADRQDWAAEVGAQLGKETLATTELETLVDAVLAKAIR